MEVFVAFLVGCLPGLFFAFIIYRNKNRQLSEAQSDLQALESKLALQEATYREKERLHDELEERLQTKFKAISSDIVGEGNRNFLQLAETVFSKYHEKAEEKLSRKEDSISQLMKPISQSLDHFNSQVSELEKQRLVAYQGVKEQLGSLKEVNQSLASETSRLAGALKSSSTRGKWGEMQLRRTVELSGMLEYCDFLEQPTVYSEDLSRLRPDLVIQLPGGRSIAVDAKVPLEAYLEASDTDDATLRSELMQKHAKQLRRQITDLSKKSYWSAFSDSPEFVIMFLPGESFFSAALEVDPSIIEAGAEQKVIIATPTTLIALLRTISFAWRQENLADNTRVIAKLGRELHERIADFTLHFEDLGKNLRASINSFNKSVGTLESRVLVSARRFQSLGIESGKKEIKDISMVDIDPRVFKSFDQS